MSRILIWSPNYAPELTGIPPLVTDAAEWLAARGHEVDVVTAMPNYPERHIRPGYSGRLWCSEQRGAVSVHRSWLRVRPGESFLDKAFYELTFSTTSMLPAIRRARTADVLVCVVPTLTAATYAAAIARAFRVRLVLWIQDLVLTGAAALDGLGPTALRILSSARRVEQFAVRSANTVIVCSPGFRDYLVGQGADPARIETILNWADTERLVATPLPANGDFPVRFLYAGNVGYSQGFETLIEAARIQGPEVDVQIVGEGNASARVRALAQGIENVKIQPPVASEEFPVLLAGADAHVVLQRRVSANANLPSKIATYLASGRPILASIEPETPAAQLLRQSGGALLVEPESPSALAEGMRLLAGRRGLREELASRGREFAVRRLGREAALGRLEAAILG